jgi:hypothetical protein
MASESSGTDVGAKVFKFSTNIIKMFNILETTKYIIVKQTM